jgi:hypothetical protein
LFNKRGKGTRKKERGVDLIKVRTLYTCIEIAQ